MPAQRADVFVRPPPVEDAELLDDLVGDSARETLERAVGNRLGQALQRSEPPARFARDESLEPAGGALARRIMRRNRRGAARAA